MLICQLSAFLKNAKNAWIWDFFFETNLPTSSDWRAFLNLLKTISTIIYKDFYFSDLTIHCAQCVTDVHKSNKQIN